MKIALSSVAVFPCFRLEVILPERMRGYKDWRVDCGMEQRDKAISNAVVYCGPSGMHRDGFCFLQLHVN